MLKPIDFGKLSYNLQTSIMKVPYYIDGHNNVMVSVSGGSDSDVVIDMIERFVKDKSKIHYVYFDTGLEYNATKQHLKDLELKYGIKIEIYKAIKSIPYTAKTFGQPFISKHVSEMCYRLQCHEFDWSDAPYSDLISRYPKCDSALKWFTNGYEYGSSFNIERNKLLREFMIENPPDFLISAKCCEYAKKKVAECYKAEFSVDLSITGLRKSEGGVRSTRYTSCFDEGKISNFRPLWNVTNSEKEQYVKESGIVHSDCYTEYGLSRTGCAGCPFGRSFEDELITINKHEPMLYNVVNQVFGKSYQYTRLYKQYVIDNS